VIGIAEVRRAAARLDGVAHRTPVVTSRTLDAAVGATVLLKAENLQRTGAFKFRGAYNAVAALAEAGDTRDVATVSSGNHAGALALAARLHGRAAVILMPRDAPAGKVAAVRGYGADVVPFDRYRDRRDELLAGLAGERGLAAVHPYDDERVMAGQGTAALELVEDAGPLDLLIVPVGGGGLASGCAVAASALLAGVRVVGVEPEAGDDARRSLAAGRIVEIAAPGTIADGQQTTALGRRPFAVLRRGLDGVVTVADADLVDAMRFAFERLKLVLEPSGASALAAVLGGRVEGVAGGRVGVVLSGGNVDARRFAALVAG
jgi:threonine dehydratase